MKTIKQITLEMLSDPDLWPNWPILAVKRYKNKFLEIGLVLYEEGYQKGIITIYYNINMYMFPKTPDEWNKAEKYIYNTVHALIDDGWEVD